MRKNFCCQHFGSLWQSTSELHPRLLHFLSGGIPALFSSNPLCPLNLRTGSVDEYEKFLANEVRRAKPVAGIWAGGLWDKPGDTSARLVYSTLAEYRIIANRFGLMPDFKEGLPRSSYRGTLPFKYNGHKLYLTHRDWPS